MENGECVFGRILHFSFGGTVVLADLASILGLELSFRGSEATRNLKATIQELHSIPISLQSEEHPSS